MFLFKIPVNDETLNSLIHGTGNVCPLDQGNRVVIQNNMQIVHQNSSKTLRINAFCKLIAQKSCSSRAG